MSKRNIEPTSSLPGHVAPEGERVQENDEVDESGFEGGRDGPRANGAEVLFEEGKGRGDGLRCGCGVGHERVGAGVLLDPLGDGLGGGPVGHLRGGLLHGRQQVRDDDFCVLNTVFEMGQNLFFPMSLGTHDRIWRR